MGNYLNSHDKERTKKVVILGSAPSAPEVNRIITEETIVICINNSWKCVDSYDFVVYADDLPIENRPDSSEFIRKGMNSVHYLDAESRFGDHFWCGFTMAFTAQYWAISLYPYSQIHLFACDMIYTGDNTHFYGKGAADPLRNEITLQSLEAKSLRAFYHAFVRNSLIYNVSESPATRLALPRLEGSLGLRHNFVDYVFWALPSHDAALIREKGERALALERDAPFDLKQDWSLFLKDRSAWDYVQRVDSAWLSLGEHIPTIQAISQKFAHMLREQQGVSVA